MNENSKKSPYRVTALGIDDLDLPWFCSSHRDYKIKLVTLERSMNGQYPLFSERVALLLNQVDENKQIRRFMPKNEWVLANYIKVNLNKVKFDYLLLIGAEVAVKPRSMGYGAGKDQYQCQNCYYVVGSRELLNESKFGQPTGERQVRNLPFHEYGNNHSEIHNLVMNLMKIILAKENIKLQT
ncbi:MAG: hypothetical protein HQM13_16250 [SAR324 cluster bacterium]|nr:hypothetical protein [SAR324 cluster bacterium]